MRWTVDRRVITRSQPAGSSQGWPWKRSMNIIPHINQCCCLSRIQDPDFCPSPITDLKIATKERGEKNIFVLPFLWSQKSQNWKLILNWRRKQFWPIYKESQKIVIKFSKIWVWDPGSRKKTNPDPGSRGQKGTGSRIRIRNTGIN